MLSRDTQYVSATICIKGACHCGTARRARVREREWVGGRAGGGRERVYEERNFITGVPGRRPHGLRGGLEFRV